MFAPVREAPPRRAWSMGAAIAAGFVLAAGTFALVRTTDVPAPPSLAQAQIRGLDYDSRRIAPGYLFFAFPGSRVDGRVFAQQAVANGALAVVSELAAPEGISAPWIQVEHGRRALDQPGA